MFAVKCPQCQVVREVDARKPWMVGDQPYERQCKRCVQLGKTKTEGHKQKLSVAVKKLQTEEVLKKKSEARKKRPDLIANLEPGAGAGWNRGMTLAPRSEETKAKISESMKKGKK